MTSIFSPAVTFLSSQDSPELTLELLQKQKLMLGMCPSDVQGQGHLGVKYVVGGSLEGAVEAARVDPTMAPVASFPEEEVLS